MSKLVWAQRYSRQVEEILVRIDDDATDTEITDIADEHVFGKHDPDHEETLEITLSLDRAVTEQEERDFGPSAVDLTGQTP